MSNIASKKEQKTSDLNFLTCYNCGTKIMDGAIKLCPNCHIILDPNNYIKWKLSWCGFLCTLCLIPIFIVILVIVF